MGFLVLLHTEHVFERALADGWVRQWGAWTVEVARGVRGEVHLGKGQCKTIERWILAV